MRALILSTYPPRRCGIASFTADLRAAILEADDQVDIGVIAVVHEGTQGAASQQRAQQDRAPDTPSRSPAEVVLQLRQHCREDYLRVAQWVNENPPDVVLVEHEFGIYGGEDGRYLLELTKRLTVPYVLTLHTVRSQPTGGQLEVLRSLCGGAARVTVFSTTGRNLLLAQHVVEAERVAVVVHGAPTSLYPSRPLRTAGGPTRCPPGISELRGLAAAPLLSTFGLISPGKGIETAIRALPQIVSRFPQARYVIAGRTHPEVSRRQGETYRESLEKLTAELGLADSVVFIDRFLEPQELHELLAATTLFITPYRSYEQIVSGVLTYAVVAACPVLSTPYLYAVDMLRDGAGRLFPFDDHRCLAHHVIELLDDPAAYAAAVASAHRSGAQHTWPEVGRHLLTVLTQASAVDQVAMGRARPGALTHPLPLAQLARLTDGVGIVQHARSTQPDHSTGYCVDDVARLGIVACGLLRSDPGNPWFCDLARLSVRFLADATDPATATMHNFCGFDRAWLDLPHTGDHVGRSIWALGELVAAAHESVAGPARDLLDTLAAAPTMPHLRSRAFALLGWSRTYESQPDPAVGMAVDELVATMMDQLEANADDGWYWFEDTLTYDNARLPQSLLAAWRARPRPGIRAAALRALDWYCTQCGVDEPVVTLVGNRWRARATGAMDDEGDEQPLDAAALVEACVEAYRATGVATYRERAVRALGWFHGRNRWGLPLVDGESQGCHDGVGRHGLNANQGAESTLAYLQARLALGAAGLDPRQARAGQW